MSGIGDEQSRPRPAYGEYATPEQIAAARGMSLDDLRRETEQHTAPRLPAAQPTDAPVTARAPSVSPYSGPDAPAPAGRKPAAAHPVDRIVTIALLAFGLFMVLFTIPAFSSLAESLQLSYDQIGVGTYGDVAFANTLGVTAIVVQLLIWAATALGSIARLRKGRLAWWVPLVGGALAVLAVLVIFFIVVLADPAFGEYATRQS